MIELSQHEKIEITASSLRTHFGEAIKIFDTLYIDDIIELCISTFEERPDGHAKILDLLEGNHSYEEAKKQINDLYSVPLSYGRYQLFSQGKKKRIVEGIANGKFYDSEIITRIEAQDISLHDYIKIIHHNRKTNSSEENNITRPIQHKLAMALLEKNKIA